MRKIEVKRTHPHFQSKTETELGFEHGHPGRRFLAPKVLMNLPISMALGHYKPSLDTQMRHPLGLYLISLTVYAADRPTLPVLSSR